MEEAAFAAAPRAARGRPTPELALAGVGFGLSPVAFSLPALAAGVSVPLVGLQVVAYVYGAVVIALAVMSLVASLRKPGRVAQT